MGLQLVEDAHAITFLVNTQFHSSGRPSDLEGANHGGSAFDGMGLAAQGPGISAAHGLNAGGGVLEERVNDLRESLERHGATETLKHGGIEDVGVGAVIVSLGNGFGARIEPARGPESVEGKRLFEDAVVAVDGSRRRGAHGEEDGAWREPAETMSELRAGETGHAEIGKDAVGRFAVGQKIESLLTIGCLDDSPAIGLEENRSDGEAHGIVVDSENPARRGCGARWHSALILHRMSRVLTRH